MYGFAAVLRIIINPDTIIINIANIISNVKSTNSNVYSWGLYCFNHVIRLRQL